MGNGRSAGESLQMECALYLFAIMEIFIAGTSQTVSGRFSVRLPSAAASGSPELGPMMLVVTPE